MAITNVSDLDNLYEHEPQCKIVTWDNISSHVENNNFSILGINVRSLKNKFAELQAILDSCRVKISILIIFETWITKKEDYAFELDGYICKSVYREEGRRGGGIKVYYRDCISVTEMDNITGISGCCEKLFIKITLDKMGPLVIGSFYRPPQSNINDFCMEFDQILRSMGNSRCIMIGDFNINTLNIDCDHAVKQYVDTFRQYGYINEINHATYHSPITNSDISCLDHILTNFNFPKESIIVKPNIADHHAVCLNLKTNFKEETKNIKFRDFSVRNVDLFIAGLNTEFLNYAPPTNNANAHAVYLTRFFTKILDKYFPTKCKKISQKRLKSPWMTTKLLKCIRKKHRWYNMMKRGQITVNCYKVFEKKLRKVLRMAEEEYHERKLESLNNDIKRTWKILNSLMGKNRSSVQESFIVDNEIVTDPAKISEAYCKHFIDHPNNIHNAVPPSNNNYMGLIPLIPEAAIFDPCTESEISRIIASMKKEGSLDDLPRKFLKLCKDYAPKCISSLINACLEQGIFPDIFKIAKITPVFKKGQKNLIKNYRPVSILCNISKIFEAVIYNRLNGYFVSKDLLSDKQYGFRKGKNTEMAS